MSKDTSIEWADSTLNLQMGCDGCELWNRKAGVLRCYAGTLTDRYGGRKGYPTVFEKPELFLERLAPALKWPDLTGKERPHKPWLNGLPRMIFLNDMGDTFTESLPIDWLAPLLPQIAASPHQWMLLTKRGGRLHAFSELHPLPPNVWPGVSVTTKRSLPRVSALKQVKGGGPKWLSCEPLWEDITPLNLEGIEMAIFGGESGGRDSVPCDLDWIRRGNDQFRLQGLKIFNKQLGSVIRGGPDVGDMFGWKMVGHREGGGWYDWKPIDAKGGNMEEWPHELRVREFPEVARG